jgi:hypothetical protein
MDDLFLVLVDRVEKSHVQLFLNSGIAATPFGPAVERSIAAVLRKMPSERVALEEVQARIPETIEQVDAISAENYVRVDLQRIRAPFQKQLHDVPGSTQKGVLERCPEGTAIELELIAVAQKEQGYVIEPIVDGNLHRALQPASILDRLEGLTSDDPPLDFVDAC